MSLPTATPYTPSTLVEERALSLLGAGISPAQVASTLGVTESLISQLVSKEGFAAELARIKTESLQKHNARDLKYDSLEDSLLDKLEKNIGMMYKPHDILKAIQVVNGAKRRGTSTAEAVIAQQNIVQIVLPTKVIQTFTSNAQNQVVQAGNQSLTTIQSGELLRQSELAEITKEVKNHDLQKLAAPHTITPTRDSNENILDI